MDFFQERKPNIRIMQTQITSKIRVSTAGIFYKDLYGERFQYETWCFSADPSQRNFQVIHGSRSDVNFRLLIRAIKIHRRISHGLKTLYGE